MLTWTTILYWIAIVIVCFIGMYLLFIFFVWVAFGLNLYHGLDAKVSKDGLEVFSRRKGKLDFYTWDEIQEIKTIFKPPITYPRIYLLNGSTIDLESASFRNIEKQLKIYNIYLTMEDTMEMVK